MIYKLFFCVSLFLTQVKAQKLNDIYTDTSVWQWSVTIPSLISPETEAPPQAFLWIPEKCAKISAVIIGQHNMLEEPILENHLFRKKMADLNIAFIWISPAIDPYFNFQKEAGEHFTSMLKSLADVSGYIELMNCPIIPIGHSAMASFPYSFAAWKPEKTLAVLSISGAWPQNDFKELPRFDRRVLEGIPCFVRMGEYEWAENRAKQGGRFFSENPKVPLTMLAEAGAGHFDFSDTLIEQLSLFISKAVKYRMTNDSYRLKNINTEDGWLYSRWIKNRNEKFPAAPYKGFKGDSNNAFWCFDEEHAQSLTRVNTKYRDKKTLLLAYQQNGRTIPQKNGTHQQVTLKFLPEKDCMTFKLGKDYLKTVPAGRPEKWINQKEGSEAEISNDPENITISRICGPFVKISEDTFHLKPYRMGNNNKKRSQELWFQMVYPGSDKFRRSVQQALMPLPKRDLGKPQEISFQAIKNCSSETKEISLNAESNAALPVHFYVKSGPAYLKGNKLFLTEIPPRSKFPVKVSVVAWQWGNKEYAAAKEVERSFYITKANNSAHIDYLQLGNPGDERKHDFKERNSSVVQGGLGEKCRVIHPQQGEKSGGEITFTLKCDPKKQNYLTAKFWGEDKGSTVLYLYHEGKRIGSNNSDWPPLDKLTWRYSEVRFPGRFYYMTYMIPRKLTDGKASVTLSIKSFGHFYSYAPNYDKAQHAQKDTSQGIYAIYTHTEPYFKPLSSEKQGKKPKNKKTYKPTVNAYEYLQKQMIKELDGALRRKVLLKADMPALARAYSCDWYPKKGDSQILKKLIHSADHYALTKEPKELGWFGAGEIAESLRKVYDVLEKQSYFDSVIQGSKTRRQVYSLFFKKCIEYQTYPFHRGGLTNQDIYINTSVYRCNLLLKKLSPELALSEEKAMDLIYQSIGLKPYRGRHLPNQKARATTSYRSIIGGPLFLTDKVDYFWVSQKGTSKEHGYVSHYGELGYQTATLYELTKDPLVKEQALKMINARAPFRSIQIDQNGRRQVRIESAIGWRHSWYNGKVEYGGIFLKPALVFQDPISIRLAQMFLEDERFLGRLGVHSRKLPLMMDRLEAVKMLESTPPSTYVFPMEDSHPDFAWADEETATIAFKDRGRKAYFSLNWRSAGINNIARFHFTEDQFDRVGNMSISTKYTPSDKTLTRPAEIARNAKGENESLATDGEVLPLAQGPRGGKADFYSLHYGPYFIIMNSSADKQFTVEFPAGTESRSYKDLITGKQIKISNTFRIQPMQTHIFRLED